MDQQPGLGDLAKSIRDQRKAFDRHIEPLRPELWRYCRRLTGSVWDAEDLVQETLLKAFASLGRYWSPTAPRAYLFRIASRAWIDANRKAAESQLEDLEAVEAGPTSQLEEEAIDALAVVVDSLTPQQRVVFLLTQAFDFTAPDVAEMLQTTEGAVKATLHRARAALRNTGERENTTQEPNPLLQKFVDAFNAKDIDALCDLLHEDVHIDIVGVAEERTRAKAKTSSIKYTLEDEDANLAALATIEGESIIVLLKKTKEGDTSVSEVIWVAVVGNLIKSYRTYYFCPEVLGEIANHLGLQALAHGYDLESPAKN